MATNSPEREYSTRYKMLAGDFARKLKKLNKNLRIYCVSDDDWRPAGIFHVVKGEPVQICGIDKHIVPEYSVMHNSGAHIKGGWRRALKILMKKGLIDRTKAERVFRTRLHYQTPKRKKRRVNIPSNMLAGR